MSAVTGKPASAPIQPHSLGARVRVRPERLGLDDRQIDIRIRPGVAPRTGAGQDDLIGVHLVHDDRRHAAQERIVDPRPAACLGPPAHLRSSTRSARPRPAGLHRFLPGVGSGNLRWRSVGEGVVHLDLQSDQLANIC